MAMKSLAIFVVIVVFLVITFVILPRYTTKCDKQNEGGVSSYSKNETPVCRGKTSSGFDLCQAATNFMNIQGKYVRQIS